MIIANFTPDPVLWMHGGVDGVLKSGDIAEMPDPRARHILNKFDRLGVLQLSFGDDPERKREEAMKLWKKFWERQVTIFNQDNERRKNTNREYVEPTEQLKEHAAKLGLELVGPWSIKQTDNETMRNILNENATLKTQIAQLTTQMSALAEAMKSREVPFELRTAAEKIEISKRGAESQPEPKNETPPVVSTPSLEKQQPEYAKLIREFTKLDEKHFGEWVVKNLDRLQSTEFPPAVLSMVKDKWARMVKSDFPVPE